jgi:hypothetical protein
MASTEWYYAHDGQQAGPVSAVELKQLADAGRLRPDDLVWQEGMKDWTPARKVKGLFEAKQAAAAPASAVAAPPVVATPLPKATDRPPSGIERITIATAERGPAERPAAAEMPTVVAAAREPVPRRHLIERLLAGIARRTGRPFVEAASLLFTEVGHWGLYAAMLGSLGLGIACATRLHDYVPLLAQVLVLPALVIVQFVARRLLDACRRLAHTGGAKIGSPALLETCALVAMLIGIATLVGMTVLAVQARLVWLALPGVTAFIVLEYLAIVALCPETLDLSVDPDAPLVEEAIGVLSFAVMTLAHLAPVLWGVGVIWAAVAAILAAVAVFSQLAPLGPMCGESAALVLLLILAPLWVYGKLVAYQLLVAVIRAVLVVPERLDKIAEGNEG